MPFSFRAPVALLLIVAVGCAVPLDESTQVIDQDALPERLRNTPSTTTTTTTTPVETREVNYYLLLSATDQPRRFVTPVARTVPDEGRISPIVAEMFDPEFTAAEDTEGLINQVEVFTFTEVVVDVDTAVATVVLEAAETDLPNSDDLRDIAAQLVWTLVQFPSVDRVQIKINGELASLPTDEGELDRPVVTDDFKTYDPNFEPPDPTTTAPAPSDDN